MTVGDTPSVSLVFCKRIQLKMLCLPDKFNGCVCNVSERGVSFC